MASGLSHILLTKYIRGMLPDFMDDMRAVLEHGQYFFQLGSVGPDLPYASSVDDDFFFSSQSKLADWFHYKKTTQLPLFALDEIRTIDMDSEGDKKWFSFSFFAGYISHIVVDGIIHPYVRDKVGNYQGHESEHRALEMAFDVLLFNWLTSESGHPINLNESKLHEEIKGIYDSQYIDELNYVADLFQRSIKNIYELEFRTLNEVNIKDVNTKKVLSWANGLYRLFEVAEGVPKIYRLPKFTSSFLFRDYDDLENRKSEFLELHRSQVIQHNDTFNGQERVHFFEHVIPQVVSRLPQILWVAYQYAFDGGKRIDNTLLPLINLDTGRSLDRDGGNLLSAPTLFWS